MIYVDLVLTRKVFLWRTGIFRDKVYIAMIHFGGAGHPKMEFYL